jgi:MFS transporter, putative metabolite:H+ symporter
VAEEWTTDVALGTVVGDRQAGVADEPESAAAEAERAFHPERVTKAALIVGVSAGLGYLFDAYVVNIYSFVLPLIQQAFHTTPAVLGTIASILLTGYMLGTFLFGYLADKWGRKPTLNLSIVTYAVTSVVSGVAGSLGLFAVLRFLTGLGGAGEIAVGVPYTAEVFPAKRRSLGAGGLIFCLYAIGALIALAVAIVLAPSLGWRVAFYFSIVPAVVVFVLRRQLTESHRHLAVKAANAAAEQSNGRPAGKRFSRDQVAEIMRTPVLARRFGLASMIWIANAVGYWGFLVFLQDYMLKKFHLTFQHSLEITMIFFAAMAIWPWIGAVTAERIGRKVAGVIGGIGIAVGIVIGFSTNVLGVFIAAEVFGIGMLGYTWAVGLTYTAELFPTKVRGTGFGLSVAVGRFPAIFGPLVTGTLISSIGLATIAKLFSILWILYIVAFLIGPETKGRPLEDL